MEENKEINPQAAADSLECAAEEVAEAAATPAKPKKLKRRFWVWVALIAFGILLVTQLIGTSVSSFILGAFNISGPMAFVMKYFATFATFIGVPLFCLTDKEVFRDVLPASKNGLKGNTLPNLLLGLFIGFAMNGVCILAAFINGDIHFVPGNVQIGTLLIAIIAVFIQSSSEEFLCRQYMLGSLRRRYPMWFAIIFNAVFFMALHLGNPGITVLGAVNIALVGIFYSVVVCYSDSLWLPMAMHTGWNYTQNFIFGLPNSGQASEISFIALDSETARNSAVYDIGFGVESTITCTIVHIILTVALIVWVVNKRKKAPAVA